MSIIFRIQEEGGPWREITDVDEPANADDFLERAVREALGDFDGPGPKYVGNYQMIENGIAGEIGKWMLDDGEFTDLE